MSDEHYRLVFSGKISDGESADEVKQRLAKLFKIDPARVDTLFDGASHVLKGSLTQEQAEAFREHILTTGAMVEVQAHAIGSNPARSKPSNDVQPDSFKGQIEPVLVTPLYKLAMAGVTLIMLLIPLLYAGVIALVGYGVLMHAVHDVHWLGHGGSGRLVAYLAPIIIGAILVAFMLKPFMLFRQERAEPMELDPQKEKRLFSFVYRICDAVGAAYPRHIMLDNEVNASASFHRGLSGMMRNELVLTMGAPLVAGMSKRQLAGILAHEFGHFSQGAGMRMSYLINWINHWLYRAVYQRDDFDTKLEQWANGGIIYTVIIFQTARFIVWLTRRLLWVFMQLGGMISSLMSRQMEFDADRYEARLAGSEQFAATSNRLNELSFAAQQLHNDQYNLWNNQSRLLHNFPAATAARTATFSEEMKQRIVEVMAEQKANIFDTHPPHAERIASARKEECPGIFHDNSPASELFSDFEVLSREVTLHFYRQQLGLKVEDRHLVDMETFEDETQRFEKERNAVLEFFLETHSADSSNQITAPDWSAVLDMEKLREQWEECCMRQRFSIELAQQTLEDLNRAYSERMNAMAASALLQAGLSIDAEDFGLPVAYVTDANNKAESCHEEQHHLRDKLQKDARHGYQRMSLALRLLTSDKALPDAEDITALRSEVDKLVAVQQRIAGVMPIVTEIRHHNYVLHTLLQNLEGEDKKVIEQINQSMETQKSVLTSLLDELKPVPFPFEHSDGDLTLATYLFREETLPDNPYQIYQLADVIDDDLIVVLYRVLGQLCLLALQLEQQHGLSCNAEHTESQ